MPSAPQDISSSSPPRRLSSLGGYARDVWAGAPRLSLATLVLLLLSSLFEGFGYILLLPILGYLGLRGGAEASGEEAGENISPIIDPVLNALNPHLSLPVVMALFFAVLACRAGLTYFAASSSAALKARFLHRHRAALHRALLTASWPFLQARRRSSLTHALTAQSNVLVGGVDLLVRGLAALITMGVAIAVAALLSWKITLSILILGLFILWPLQRFNRRAYRLGETARKDMTALFEHSIRYFKGLKSIKAASAETEILAYFNRKSEAQSNTFEQLERNHAKASLVYQLLSAVFLVGLVYLALTYFPDQKTQLIVLIIIFARLAPRVNALQSYANGLAAVLADYEAALALRRSASAAFQERAVEDAPLKIERDLTLSNISFWYDAAATDTPVLGGLSLRLPAKSSTVITGPSGAGKTTLIDIISGLLPPSSGTLKIDDIPLTDTARCNLSSSVHYVPDDDFLFDDSVKNNLALGRTRVSEDEIWNALEKANAHHFVRDLDHGLETRLGDSGARLSHGQRQRLSLARGLLGGPQILILDEPTSALGEDDVTYITKTLKELARSLTLIIVTHDEAAFRWADQTIRLKDGQLCPKR